MEWKIGEIFEYNGEWYQCVEGDCVNCAFYIDNCDDCSLQEIIGNCCIKDRVDRYSVIFKKLEKVGEPYHNSEKKLCQQYKCYINPLVTDEIVYVFADNKVVIEIKQPKEDMEEKKQKLGDLVGLYSSGKIAHKEFEKGIRELYEKRSNSEKIGKNLKPFDLEAAKAGKPVCTRDGRKARIICFDKQDGLPIVALVETKVNGRISEEIALFYIDGRAVSVDIDSKLDLMMLPEKRSGWINVYYDNDTSSHRGCRYIYDTKELAVKEAGSDYITTIKINWEE